MRAQAGCQHQPVEGAVGGLAHGADRAAASLGLREVRDHLGVAQVHADHPIALLLEALAGGGSDARRGARDGGDAHVAVSFRRSVPGVLPAHS